MQTLEQESGGHRVQRIPPGERRGRVHSSTVTVAVLDPKESADGAYRQRSDGDFDVSFFSGTGPGGQNRNKVQASARIVHKPTGLVRTAQTRSRENSVRLAKAALEAALDAAAETAKMEKTREIRSGQTGSGERGDKRRTYRFQEGLVHDHLSGRRSTTEAVLKGRFEMLWPAGQANPQNGR